jgi:hypothetical protein
VRFSPAARTAATALSALAVLLAPTTAHAAAATRTAAPGDSVTLPVRDALAALPVQGESRTGYERTKFKHWTDADHDSEQHPAYLHAQIGVKHNTLGAYGS